MRETSNKKIDFIIAGKFILGLLLIHFLFFGYICNIFNKTPGDNLLFVYLSFFNSISWASILILFAIGVVQAFREDFLIYAIKNSIWTIPFIILMSWFWYMINYFNIPFLYNFWSIDAWGYWFSQLQLDFIGLINLLGSYFTSINGYLNILVLGLVYISAGILGGYFKTLYFAAMKKRNIVTNVVSIQTQGDFCQ